MPVLFGILAATWLTIGAVLSVLMGRRGHDAFAWFVLGMFLGPIALILAVYTDRSPHRHETRMLAQPHKGAGPVDVLVGFDGSPESRAAAESLRAEAERLRPREVGLEVVEGSAHTALTDLAAAAGYDVLAIGTRGTGLVERAAWQHGGRAGPAQQAAGSPCRAPKTGEGQ